MIQDTNAYIPARVTAVHRERYAVLTARGEGFARLKAAAYRDAGTRDLPTVGDYVDLIDNEQGDGLIVATHPRRSLFTRKLPGTSVREQAVAANFDEVFVLVSLNRDFSPRRIERYAALSWQSGATPVVVLTKRDLAGEISRQILEAAAAAPGADVCAVSACTGEGLPALFARLSPGKTVALLGSSGVGKSTLVNALAGQCLMKTGDIREEDARGRHTTTARQLLTLPMGAHVIDTPGMRELGLWDAEEGLREAFDDIEALARSCRFYDCAHRTEPGCAVRGAMEAGELDEKRLQSYEKLRREAARRERRKQRGRR